MLCDYEEISEGRLVIVIQGVSTGSFARSTDDVSAIGGAAPYAPVLTSSLVRAAWRGLEVRASELAAATIEEAESDNQGLACAVAEYARAVLYNGLGRYERAAAAAVRACRNDALGSQAWALLELVEAAARSDAHGIASDALARLEEQARACRSDWALGVHARSAALLSDGDNAEGLYRQAIDLLDHSRLSAHRARAQLVYGEWLRRENRRVDARVQLRAAGDTFARIGAQAFGERARRELVATGETARRRTNDTRDVLTPQEATIARLARDGLSNPEIGARLFLSPRTVQYHLRKVFQKLNITSRNQLGRIALERLAA